MSTDASEFTAHPTRDARMLGRRIASGIAPLAGLAFIMIVFRIIAPDRPLTTLDLSTIAVHTVIVGIAALGMTVIIISGGIDLSVGSAIALVSVAAALTMRATGSVLGAVGVSLAVGAMCGAYNGGLTVGLGLPPFIATLGTLGFYRGLAKWLAQNSSVSAPTGGLDAWVQPVSDAGDAQLARGVWVLIALALVVTVLLRYSIPGRYAFAIGSNEATARLCGIRVERMKLLIYIAAGLLTGLAGLVQFARLTQGDPTVAVGLELDIIAAVVIGGGSLSGGQGGVLGTLTGAFLMTYLKNRCTALGWSNYVQEMIVGHIIIVAVALDQLRLRRQRS